MTNQLDITQREDWLNQAASLFLDEIGEQWPIRKSLKVRFSMGDKGRDTKVLGHCYNSAASNDGHNQIFITPREENSELILAILLHELIHAVDDNQSGHRGDFAKIARLMGFTGPRLTAIDTGNPSESFSESRWASIKEIVDMLGPIPHGKLDTSKIKRDTNRNIKVWCDCGFKFNTSRTQIRNVLDNQGAIACPNCGNDMEHTA